MGIVYPHTYFHASVYNYKNSTRNEKWVIIESVSESECGAIENFFRTQEGGNSFVRTYKKRAPSVRAFLIPESLSSQCRTVDYFLAIAESEAPTS